MCCPLTGTDGPSDRHRYWAMFPGRGPNVVDRGPRTARQHPGLVLIIGRRHIDGEQTPKQNALPSQEVMAACPPCFPGHSGGHWIT